MAYWITKAADAQYMKYLLLLYGYAKRLDIEFKRRYIACLLYLKFKLNSSSSMYCSLY